MATKIIKSDQIDAGAAVKAVDWDAIDRMTDADIARQIAENPDAATETTDAFFEKAKFVSPADRKKK